MSGESHKHLDIHIDADRLYVSLGTLIEHCLLPQTRDALVEQLEMLRLVLGEEGETSPLNRGGEFIQGVIGGLAVAGRSYQLLLDYLGGNPDANVLVPVDERKVHTALNNVVTGNSIQAGEFPFDTYGQENSRGIEINNDVDAAFLADFRNRIASRVGPKRYITLGMHNAEMASHINLLFTKTGSTTKSVRALPEVMMKLQLGHLMPSRKSGDEYADEDKLSLMYRFYALLQVLKYYQYFDADLDVDFEALRDEVIKSFKGSGDGVFKADGLFVPQLIKWVEEHQGSDVEPSTSRRFVGEELEPLVSTEEINMSTRELGAPIAAMRKAVLRRRWLDRGTGTFAHWVGDLARVVEVRDLRFIEKMQVETGLAALLNFVILRHSEIFAPDTQGDLPFVRAEDDFIQEQARLIDQALKGESNPQENNPYLNYKEPVMELVAEEYLNYLSRQSDVVERSSWGEMSDEALIELARRVVGGSGGDVEKFGAIIKNPLISITTGFETITIPGANNEVAPIMTLSPKLKKVIDETSSAVIKLKRSINEDAGFYKISDGKAGQSLPKIIRVANLDAMRALGNTELARALTAMVVTIQRACGISEDNWLSTEAEFIQELVRQIKANAGVGQTSEQGIFQHWDSHVPVMPLIWRMALSKYNAQWQIQLDGIT